MSFEVMVGVLITTFCPLSVFFSSNHTLFFHIANIDALPSQFTRKDLKVLLHGLNG